MSCYSDEQILTLAAETRELRSQGHIIPEGVMALSLARVIREHNALRKENKHILDEVLPALPREIELGSDAEDAHFTE